MEFGMQTRAPNDDGASKRGGPISNQVRMHAYHLTYIYIKKPFAHIFELLQENP